MIRQAVPRDFESLKHIKNMLGLEVDTLGDLAYRLKVQKNGFLLKRPAYREEEFQTDLQKIYLVCEDAGQVNGYVRIDETQEMEKGAEAWWFIPELMEPYFSLPHADIGGIAVLPEASHKGVATNLLTAAIAAIKQKRIPYLFSFVVLSPVTNMPSILFHEKNGFHRIALVNESEFFQLKKYQSFLYGKKLS